jgi:hypothetical protein
MFNRAKGPSQLDKEFDRAMDQLSQIDITSDEYVEAVNRISPLHKMKQEEKASGVSKDTMVIAGTNILGILLIIRHEHLNVITSRAMNMVQKLK